MIMGIKQRLYKYGISSGDYLQILLDQDKKCAICKQSKELVIDHCHENNHVRGLLCRQCNLALGLFKDNVSYMNNAIEYLINNSIPPPKMGAGCD